MIELTLEQEVDIADFAYNARFLSQKQAHKALAFRREAPRSICTQMNVGRMSQDLYRAMVTKEAFYRGG